MRMDGEELRPSNINASQDKSSANMTLVSVVFMLAVLSMQQKLNQT